VSHNIINFILLFTKKTKNRKIRFFIFLISNCLLFPSISKVKANPVIDTTKIYSIPEIVVTGQIKPSEVRSSTPLQILTSKQIENLNVLQVSDAIKYFSGIVVKDYGGIGGLKTVSVRGLDANHTAVSYDGITLSDCQTGQIDLGRFSIENVDLLTFNNGQNDNIFQPARLFASASVLNIQTSAPFFKEKEKIKGKVSFKSGSFGLVNPSSFFQGKINQQLSAVISSEWLSAKGNYPYLLKYGTGVNDSTSWEKRKNTDVKNFRLEGALYYKEDENSSGYLKSYFYSSERGLPGATILYLTENSNRQRSWDRTFFTQAHYEKKLSSLVSFGFNAKYHYGFLKYLDPDVNNSLGKIENIYRQQEYYSSFSFLFQAFEHLSFSSSTDIACNTLSANLTDFAYPTRWTLLSCLNGKYVNHFLLTTAGLLVTKVNDKVRYGKAPENYQQLSPYTSISVKPFTKYDVRFRCFYKNIFRMPTFNDLYYVYVGNRDLKPEKSHQFNVGITYCTSLKNWLPLLTITLDAYHNEVKNKIIAFPQKDIFNWTMKNYGKVLIDGLDLSVESSFSLSEKIGIIAGTTYTYQKAINVTDPSEENYRHQIPYTPRVSGSGKAALQTPWFNIAYSFLWSGKRYALFQNYTENRLSGYADHSISLQKEIKIKQQALSLNVEILNLWNTNYEIIRWYPMPGRSFRITAATRF